MVGKYIASGFKDQQAMVFFLNCLTLEDRKNTRILSQNISDHLAAYTSQHHRREMTLTTPLQNPEI
jgi:hypothetical protein